MAYIRRMESNQAPQVIRRITRTCDYGYRTSLWLENGPHLHGHGRTKLASQEAAERILASYIATFFTRQEAN